MDYLDHFTEKNNNWKVIIDQYVSESNIFLEKLIDWDVKPNMFFKQYNYVLVFNKYKIASTFKEGFELDSCKITGYYKLITWYENSIFLNKLLNSGFELVSEKVTDAELPTFFSNLPVYSDKYSKEFFLSDNFFNWIKRFMMKDFRKKFKRTVKIPRPDKPIYNSLSVIKNIKDTFVQELNEVKRDLFENFSGIEEILDIFVEACWDNHVYLKITLKE